MPEVVVSNPDLSVYGPTTAIDVQVDIGPTGTRGSKQFVGSVAPTSGVIPETPLLNDMYLNVSNSYLYQYINDAGTNKWMLVGKFAPFTYNTVSTKTFTSGSASFSFDINTMFGITTTTKEFVITASFVGTFPIAFAISQPALSGTTLTFDITGQKHNGSFWDALSGSQKVMLSISLAA